MAINDYWKEGRHVDLWSVNHLLSGVVSGSLLFHFGVPFLNSLIIASILFVSWELVERFFGIKEHLPNVIMDVVYGLLGFFLVSYFYFVLKIPFNSVAIAIPIILLIIFALWGFLAYEKRHRLE